MENGTIIPVESLQIKSNLGLGVYIKEKKKSVILAKAWICVAFWERPSDINRVHISSSDFFQVAKTCFLLI